MKVDRLVSIIMILLDKKRIGAQKLADLFEVSPRTIYRDVDAINMAGIPIRSTPGVGGGFEIMPDYKVDKKVFSSEDLSAIMMGLSGLSNVMRGNELVNALAKVKSFIPADRAREIEVKSNQIHIDLSPWMGNESIQPYIEQIQDSMQANRLLSFRYINHSGISSERTVEPYQLVLKGSQWYLQAFCHSRNDFRLFKLSRMQELYVLSDSFIPKEFPKPLLDIMELSKSMQINITIRIHRSIMDRILDYCSYDNFTPDNGEFYLVTFPFYEKDYYFDLLLSFGDKCECLQPPKIREEIKQRIQNLVRLYE